jgi:hypothetical protein
VKAAPANTLASARPLTTNKEELTETPRRAVLARMPAFVHIQAKLVASIVSDTAVNAFVLATTQDTLTKTALNDASATARTLVDVQEAPIESIFSSTTESA